MTGHKLNWLDLVNSQTSQDWVAPRIQEKLWRTKSVNGCEEDSPLVRSHAADL